MATETATTDLTVATTILEQLGGKRFLAMTGARDLVGGPDFLQFRIPMRTKDGSNKVRITLTPLDVYTLETYFVRGITCKLKTTKEDVYVDMLTDIFTHVTGLYTRL